MPSLGSGSARSPPTFWREQKLKQSKMATSWNEYPNWMVVPKPSVKLRLVRKAVQMVRSIRKSLTIATRLVVLSFGVLISGCAWTHLELPKGMIGRLGKYDYSPSVIQT